MKRHSCIYRKSWLLLLMIVASFSLVYANGSKKLLINEFLTSNSTGLMDEDGDLSDWIELYNPGTETIHLSGWSLTDNENKPKKWIFPAVSIKGREYIVVFASGKDRRNVSGELHTNFSLAKEGEYLAVVEPNGTISDAYAPVYPPQETDISYGYYLGIPTYFNTPTPGTENTLEGQALTPEFSVERGYYKSSFTVSLTTHDPDTKIYYTTDGTRPTAESRLYTSPVSISKTTPLSAAGIKGDAVSSVVTHTYFFIEDIIDQPENPEGYPDRWGYLGGDVIYDKYKVGERAPAHYVMEQEVTKSRKYQREFQNAFSSIPTISIVTNPDYLFSDEPDEEKGGIYIYTGVGAGRDWERPVSIEYYDPTTEKQFQINCGLRMHGAASRQPEKSGKHSFRSYFRKLYGAGKLRFDLFEEETAVEKFDHLVFRAGFGYSWLHWSLYDRNYSQYVIDSFAKRTQRLMGHPAAHDRFVHLFINGLYWGLYDISERIRDNFMESYFGGEDVDYDVISHNGLVDGDRSAFDRMVMLAQDGKYDELVSEKLLDMENYIDYMLINFYMGNTDWGDNNWYTARNRVSSRENGFRFFTWDTENCFFSGLHFNVITDGWRFTGPLRKIIFGNNEQTTKGGLSQHEEFRLLFADRVQKHFFNGGALSEEKTAKLYANIAEEINTAIIAESARWGSYRSKTLPGDGVSPVYNRDDHWLPQKEYLLKEYFPERTYIVYDQLWSSGLLPDIEAPVFSSGSGVFTQSFELSINTASGIIYYTINGTDPREKGTGNISKSAIQYSSPLLVNGAITIKVRAKEGNTWSALSEVVFTVDNSVNIKDALYGVADISYYHDIMQIALLAEGEVIVNIYTIDGKRVRQINITGRRGDNRIELNNLSKGIYIYNIHFNGRNYSGKLIK